MVSKTQTYRGVQPLRQHGSFDYIDNSIYQALERFPASRRTQLESAISSLAIPTQLDDVSDALRMIARLGFYVT